MNCPVLGRWSSIFIWIYIGYPWGFPLGDAVDQVPCNLTIASRIVGEFYSHYSSKHIPILNRSQMIFQLKRKGYLWVPSSNQTWLVDVVDIELRLVKFFKHGTFDPRRVMVHKSLILLPIHMVNIPIYIYGLNNDTEWNIHRYDIVYHDSCYLAHTICTYI